MITLITGAPGAGKSSYLVSELLRIREQSPERPLYVGGVPDLAIEHEPLPPAAEWVEASDSANGWRWRFPDGAVIVLDEAQSVFRPRASGSQVPPHVAALEVHRHQGLDVFLCTQAPALIDSNVRRLVGRHCHLRATWAGRRLLEWSECVDPSSRSERSAAVSRPWKLPKKVQSLYTSASVHVRPSRRIPWQVGLIALVLVGLIYGGTRVYGRIYGDERVYGASSQPFPVDPVPAVGAVSGPQPVALSPEAFVPRLRGRPESAPLYDQIRQVKQMPVVVGCVAVADRCTCYTQQATDAFVDDAACREWIQNPPFQPFVEPRRATQQLREVAWAGERSDTGQGDSGGRVVLIEASDRLSGARSVSDESPRPPNRGPHRSVQLPGF